MNRIDFNGKTSTFTYDLMDRVLSRTADPSFAQPAETFTYTSDGLLASMSDASGNTTFSYDPAGRLAQKVTAQGTLAYTYDGNTVKSLISSNVNGVNIGYTYDARRRLTAIVDNPSGRTTQYRYSSGDQLLQTLLPNALSEQYIYDSAGRITNMTLQPSGTPLASFGYTWGYGGTMQQVTDAAGNQTAYSYDPLYRLTRESSSDISSAGAVGYTLDAVGNRTAQNSSLSGISSGNSTYDANDRLSNLTWDSNGNLLGLGPLTLQYDGFDRLTGATGPISYLYNAFDDRVGKTAAGSTARYLIDDQSPSGLPQVVEELAGGAVVRSYLHGVRRINQRLWQGSSSTTSYFGYDAGGSVRLLTDSAGTPTDTFTYDAFGNLLARTGATGTGHLFRGEYLDSDLGAYYNRSRFYDPRSGRFITTDPETGDQEYPATQHPYLYAGADPVNRTDPTGRAFAYASLLRNPIVVGTALIGATAAFYAVHPLAGSVQFPTRQFQGAVLSITGAIAACTIARASVVGNFWRDPRVGNPTIDQTCFGTRTVAILYPSPQKPLKLPQPKKLLPLVIATTLGSYRDCPGNPYFVGTYNQVARRDAIINSIYLKRCLEANHVPQWAPADRLQNPKIGAAAVDITPPGRMVGYDSFPAVSLTPTQHSIVTGLQKGRQSQSLMKGLIDEDVRFNLGVGVPPGQAEYLRWFGYGSWGILP